MDSSIRGMHESAAEARKAGRVDTVGHSGVQPWSAGEIFPATIARVEVYYDDWQGVMNGSDVCINAHVSLESRLKNRYWTMTLDGITEEGYASREDAESAARYLLDTPHARESRKVSCDHYGVTAIDRHFYGDREMRAPAQPNPYGAPRAQLARTDWAARGDNA